MSKKELYYLCASTLNLSTNITTIKTIKYNKKNLQRGKKRRLIKLREPTLYLVTQSSQILKQLCSLILLRTILF